MKLVLIIARKEIKEVFSNTGSVAAGLIIALFFTVSRGIVSLGGRDPIIGLENTVFYLAAAIGLFMAYISTSQVFLTEKRDRIIETLLSSPVTVRQVWLGKVIGAAFYPYLLAVITSVVLIMVASFYAGSLVLPGTAVIVYIFLAVPVFVAAYSGITGFAQLLLGMRENRIVNLVLFIPSFAVLYGVGLTVGATRPVSWLQVGIFLAASATVMVITAILGRFLSKERIVTTIS